MSLAARFVFNKRELTAFEEFMTDSLQKEIERAYARALNRLGRGCVNGMKRKLEKSDDPDDRTLLKSGIAHSPNKVKRIMELKPPRIAIGAGSTRRRHPDKSLLVGNPFRVTVSNEKGRRVALIAQRNVYSEHIDGAMATSPKRIKTVTPSGAVMWSRKTYQSHQSFEGYRNTALPITIISPLDLTPNQITKFRYMIEEYMTANHDKVVEQEYKKAVERAAKKR